MKRILLSCFLLLSVYTLRAQDACLNDVVNTLKERISLAGYAQVGYTYDDAGEKASNSQPVSGNSKRCTPLRIPCRPVLSN